MSAGAHERAFALEGRLVHLARDGAMRPAPRRGAGAGARPIEDRTLAFLRVETSQDVHYPAWEMHPAGDELLILTSGSLSVQLRAGKGARTLPLAPRSAVLVPAGVWHRVIVHAPSALIAITPREGTRHQRGIA